MKKRKIDCRNAEEFSRILALTNCELNEGDQQKKTYCAPPVDVYHMQGSFSVSGELISRIVNHKVPRRQF
jgi:hypothetical protein